MDWASTLKFNSYLMCDVSTHLALRVFSLIYVFYIIVHINMVLEDHLKYRLNLTFLRISEAKIGHRTGTRRNLCWNGRSWRKSRHIRSGDLFTRVSGGRLGGREAGDSGLHVPLPLPWQVAGACTSMWSLCGGREWPGQGQKAGAGLPSRLQWAARKK